MPPTPAVAIANEVEEPADRWIHRPLARPLVRLLAPTPLTPNHVTLLSGVSGITGAICLAASAARPPLRIAAAALVLLAAVLDCADGQLARHRGRSSPGGGALDGVVDEAVGAAVILSATYLVQHSYGPSAWAVGVAALISAALQCLMFDAAKEGYLRRFGVSHAPSKLAMVDSHATLMAGSWLQRLFRSYADRIRALASWLSPEAGGDHQRARRRMHVWTMLGLGTHMTIGYLAIAASAVWPPALYWCLIIFSTVMNVQLALLVSRERSARASSLEGARDRDVSSVSR